MRFTTKVLPSRRGNVGILLLNNPKPLHALTLDMAELFQDALTEWYKDDTVKAILVKSTKESKVPAFCAGGDVKSVYMQGQEPGAFAGGSTPMPGAAFFRQEYMVNAMLATAPKPQVSLWDGLVMGGGAGISIHGKYRVATENSVFAMPETAIGLFPDVGSTYWMPRMLPEAIAVYLALTGQRLQAPDLIYTGLATHYVPSDKMEELEQALVAASEEGAADKTGEELVAPVLMSFHQDPQQDPSASMLAQERKNIDEVFSSLLSDTTRGVEDVVSSLEALQSEFGRTTLDTINKMSPTSLKLVLEGLRRGQKVGSVHEALTMEYRMMLGCVAEGKDFYEGIRAVLVDKDHNPKWKPDKLWDVTDEMIAAYFEPVQEELDTAVVQSKL